MTCVLLPATNYPRQNKHIPARNSKPKDKSKKKKGLKHNNGENNNGSNNYALAISQIVQTLITAYDSNPSTSLPSRRNWPTSTTTSHPYQSITNPNYYPSYVSGRHGRPAAWSQLANPIATLTLTWWGECASIVWEDPIAILNTQSGVYGVWTNEYEDYSSTVRSLLSNTRTGRWHNSVDWGIP